MKKPKRGTIGPRKPKRHPVDRVFGILKLAKPVDVLLDEMRGRAEPKPSRRSDSRRS
jgi:hypothetical protein